MEPQPPPDWHLREWMQHFGKKQAALVNELGWTKGRAHQVWHGSIPYRREVVNELATWLKIKPYELLMPPEEALALSQLRQTARAIAAQDLPEREAPAQQKPQRKGHR